MFIRRLFRFIESMICKKPYKYAPQYVVVYPPVIIYKNDCLNLLFTTKTLIYQWFAEVSEPQYLVKNNKNKYNILCFAIDKCHKMCYTYKATAKSGVRKMGINIQGYQKMTLLDFPGKVACTVFTGGCNLRCPFCHNAGLVKTPTAEENAYGDVIDYLKKRKGIIDGVCVTGGEPLLQPHLSEFLSEIKEMGYLVKLDTNGALPDRLKHILSLSLVDYVAMDIKSSPEGYEKASGSEIPFETFYESIKAIRESGVEHEFRTTAVKGIHSKEDFLKIADILLPEENYFIQRFTDSGNLLSDGCSAFSDEEMKEIYETVRKKVPRVKLRGVDI